MKFSNLIQAVSTPSIVLGLLFVSCLQAQEPPQVKVNELRSGVYMLQGQGGNIGLAIGSDAVFMIDDQYAQMSENIKHAVGALTKAPVKFILNTHWHGDHTGGNEHFAKSGSIIIAHENVYKRLSTDQLMQAFNVPVKASPVMALPVVTFAQEVGFHLNNDFIQAIHVENAHTDGDAIIHFTKANVLHMGDVFFNGRYPFIDVGSGGTLDGILAAVELGLELSDENTFIIPGHGSLAKISDLQKYHDVLSDINKQFKALKAAGKSDEEITDEAITLDYDEDWGGGFIGPEKFIEILLSQPDEKPIHQEHNDEKGNAAGQKAAHH
jgi:glyoxylase-like metal-dependent hydrolase (beta-lactamase superfamily II)